MPPNYRLWTKCQALVLALTGLLGSAYAQPSGQERAIAFERLSLSIHVDRCDRGRCAQLDWQTIRFQGQPALNRAIDLSLWALLASDEPLRKTKPDLSALNDYFHAQAKPGEQVVLQTDLLRQTPHWIVLSVSKYQFEGGAHGLSSERFVNWDVTSAREVTLDDALKPKARTAYEQALKRAHTQWLDDQQRAGAIQNVSEFVEQWPFVPSDNVAFMAQGWLVGYPRYAIAPGSFGEPAIMVPYSALVDIIDPDFY